MPKITVTSSVFFSVTAYNVVVIRKGHDQPETSFTFFLTVLQCEVALCE